MEVLDCSKISSKKIREILDINIPKASKILIEEDDYSGYYYGYGSTITVEGYKTNSRKDLNKLNNLNTNNVVKLYFIWLEEST